MLTQQLNIHIWCLFETIAWPASFRDPSAMVAIICYAQQAFQNTNIFCILNANGNYPLANEYQPSGLKRIPALVFNQKWQ